MFTTISAPIGAGVVSFVTAVTNLVVVLGIWDASPVQLAALNTVVLTGLALFSAIRSHAQSIGTLTSTPAPPAPAGP